MNNSIRTSKEMKIKNKELLEKSGYGIGMCWHHRLWQQGPLALRPNASTHNSMLRHRHGKYLPPLPSHTYIFNDKSPILVLHFVGTRILEECHGDGMIVWHRPLDMADQWIHHIRFPGRWHGGHPSRTSRPHHRQIRWSPGKCDTTLIQWTQYSYKKNMTVFQSSNDWFDGIILEFPYRMWVVDLNPISP